MNCLLPLIASLSVVASANNLADADSVIAADKHNILSASFANGTGADNVGSLSWDNPSLMSFRKVDSECSAIGGFRSQKSSRPIVTGKGLGDRDFFLHADAYIHSGKNSTVWGSAAYDNGKQLSPLWNESGEYDRIFPYLIADSIGGDLSREKYSFSGGYVHVGNRILWGVEGGYTAVLSYRRVDPRPRNVSGDLILKGGLAYRFFNDYTAGISLRYNRFRLSTDITFVNETGETKLFHLTGLGSHYVRFDGAGSSVFNDCHTGGITLNLLPVKGKGAFVNLDMSLMNMRHVIADINRLPLARLNDKSLKLQAGYKRTPADKESGFNYALWGEWSASRRHGTENIFGDPTSGSYPQIGSLTLYADNIYGGSVSAFTSWTNRRFSISLLPVAGWFHQRIVHLSDNRQWLDEHLTLALDASTSLMTSKNSLLSVSAALSALTPTSSSLILPEPGTAPEDKALYDLTKADFEAATSSSVTLKIGAQWLRMFSRRIAAGLSAGYIHSSVSNGIKSDGFNIGIIVKFI
ncbi:MAG: hypothetical protein HDS93_02315 [Bacteroidales bacterium]|nr:hypothetical protein [Bacteroidales bacterium]